MVTRWSEKSPGLKILWVWTFGTAAVLIASVVRTRLNDMEKILRQEEESPALPSQSQSQYQSESQSLDADVIFEDD